MGDVIRAVDLEDNSDAIEIPTGMIDPSITPEVKEEIKAEEEPSDITAPESIEDTAGDIKPEVTPNKLDNISDEDLEAMSDDELDALLSEIEEEQEEVTDGIDDNTSQDDIDFALKEKDALLKSVSDRLESKLRENADLKVQLAEKDIFGGEGKEEMTILHTNMGKARDGDEGAKTKVIEFLDTIRKELTGKTFGESDLDKDADIISNSNSIRPSTEPSTPSSEELEETIKVL